MYNCLMYRFPLFYLVYTAKRLHCCGGQLCVCVLASCTWNVSSSEAANFHKEIRTAIAKLLVP